MDRLFQAILSNKNIQAFGFIAAGLALGSYVAIQVFHWPQPVVIGVAIGAMLVLWGYNLFLKGMSKRKVSSFEKGLVQDMGSSGGGKVASRKAQEELAGRWNQAVAEIKKSGMDLYTLPWYLLIGEPQSGKSTTLKNSGLEFPVGTESLSGAGGTRNCDWWFTNEAIILDTAGRFSFQEKNAPDASEWKKFLELLKKKRTACPINGLILVIPCTSLLNDDDDTREMKATNIREKLQQLQRDLGIQFPVFILITKCDQILGFSEFFSRLSATDQRQLLGWSMPGQFIQAYDPNKFYEAFDGICDRIHKVRLKLLSEDLGLQEVDKLFVFPEEFKSLRSSLHDYLKSIFVKTHYLPPLFMRGFYFTSGLQQGKPVARAVAALMSHASGAADAIVEELAKAFAKSKAFFIRDFYVDKLFPERSLILHAEKKTGMNRGMALALLVGSALLICGSLGYMGWRVLKLTQGINKVNEYAPRMKDEFIQFANLSRGTAAESVMPEQVDKDKKPLTLASSILTAHTFTQDVKSAGLEDNADFKTQLRDIHWLYFLQNVMQRRGRDLYREMLASEPGSSQATKKAEPLYQQYAKLWGLNSSWIEHTKGKDGPFANNEKLVFDPQLLAAPEIDKEKFESEIEETRKQLNQDLEFSGSGPTAPIRLDLVPGPVEVEANQPIKRELDQIDAAFSSVDDATVRGLIAAAQAAQKNIPRAGSELMMTDCGYRNSDTDLFGPANKSAQEIQGTIDALKDIIKKNAAALTSATKSKEDIGKEFDKLAWKNEAAGTTAGGNLDAAIKNRVEVIEKRIGEQGKAANRMIMDAHLEDVVDIKAASMDLTAAAKLVDEGMGIFRDLGPEQQKQIKALEHPGRKIMNSDEIGKIVEEIEGQKDAVRLKALDWVKRASELKDAPPSLKLADFAGNMKKAIDNGHEALLVEAWVTFAKSIAPEALMKGGIQNAKLDSDPPKGIGAIGKEVKDADDAMADVQKKLDGFKAGLVCKDNVSRIGASVESLKDVGRKNHANLLAFWQSAYDNWHPYSWINTISPWDAFRTHELMSANGISKRAITELGRISENMQPFEGDMKEGLKNAAKLAQPGGALETNANNFSSTVAGMPASVLEAAIEVKKPDTKKKLEAIAKETNVLSDKFRQYPDYVRSLLRGPDLGVTLGGFLGYWRPRLTDNLKGKFPFKVPPETVVVDAEKGTVTIPQVSTKELKDFFFDPSNGLVAFLEKYKAPYEEWKQQPENSNGRNFIDQCLVLRDYFFDEKGADYRNLRITQRSVATKGKQEDYSIYPTEMKVKLPPNPEDSWRARPGGSKKDEAFEWKPGISGGEGLTFAWTNEGYGKVANVGSWAIPNDFSILAFICTSPEVEAAEKRKKWKGVVIDVTPRKGWSGGKLGVVFDFGLDRELPEFPDWSTVESLIR